MERPSRPSEGCSVTEQVDLQHDVQSDSALCPDADNRVSEPAINYVMDCSKVLLHLR